MSEPATTRAAPQRFPRGRAVVPHRKNAAEWAMWLALWPVAWVARRFTGRRGA